MVCPVQCLCPQLRVGSPLLNKLLVAFYDVWHFISLAVIKRYHCSVRKHITPGIGKIPLVLTIRLLKYLQYQDLGWCCDETVEEQLGFSDSPNSIIFSSYEETITQSEVAPPADPADLTDVPFINQI